MLLCGYPKSEVSFLSLTFFFKNWWQYNRAMSNLKIALCLELFTCSLKGSSTHKEIWCSDFPFPPLFTAIGMDIKKENKDFLSNIMSCLYF